MHETTPANTSSIIKRGVTLLALLILTETSFLENQADGRRTYHDIGQSLHRFDNLRLWLRKSKSMSVNCRYQAIA